MVVVVNQFGGVAMEVERISRVLGVVYRRSLGYMNAFSQELGLSALECIFLVSILANEGINQEQLSTLHAIDKSATAKAMKSLEAKGFILREKALEDKRSKRVFSTQKGQECREFIHSRLQTYIDFLSGNVSSNDVDATFATLEVMANRLNDWPVSSTSHVEIKGK